MPTQRRGRPPRPSWLRARLAKWALLPYRVGLGPLLAGQVMVLTTRGRVTGKVRKTPLWYARDGAAIYCISGWGSSSDWLKNLEADPQARVQIGKQRWETRGEPIHDPAKLRGVVHSFEAKYGRRVLRLFYHVDLLVLVAFPLRSPDMGPSS